MINSRTIQNCKVPFPIIEGLAFAPLTNKIEIKNIYQKWQGQSIHQIKQTASENEYSLRIGLPRVDEQLRHDNIHFILGYLSYNPVSNDIENREIITYRNTSKVFIGQSPDEYKFKNFKLFVDDNVIAKDFIFSDDEMSVKQTIMHLANKVQKLQEEIFYLKSQTKNETIYK